MFVGCWNPWITSYFVFVSDSGKARPHRGLWSLIFCLHPKLFVFWVITNSESVKCWVCARWRRSPDSRSSSCCSLSVSRLNYVSYGCSCRRITWQGSLDAQTLTTVPRVFQARQARASGAISPLQAGSSAWRKYTRVTRLADVWPPHILPKGGEMGMRVDVQKLRLRLFGYQAGCRERSRGI